MNVEKSEKFLIKEKLKKIIKDLRKISEIENEKDIDIFNNIIFTEERISYLNNEKINRLVVFLRGTGCYLAKNEGGCTFCGFYNATNFGKKIEDKYYINQIKNLIKNCNIEKYPFICLYNDGSLLCEEEISTDILIKMLKILNNINSIKKITIESRIDDITEEKVIKLCNSTTKKIEIAVGYESANPIIRSLCINKEFDNKKFEYVYYICKKNNVDIIPLLILKPPFLTEEESIKDFINSIIYLEKFNLNRVDIELPTIQKYTLTYELWKQNLYKPISLWAVIEILRIKKELNLKTPIYISPTNYSVENEAKAYNCDKCSNKIYNLFEIYNQYQNIDIFNNFHCDCKNSFADELEKKDFNKNLDERINFILQILEKKRK